MRNFFLAFCFAFVLIQIIGTAKVCYASEKSEVDPLKKHMSLKTQNLTFGHHISVDEVLHYTPHPSDPSKTLLKQEATVSVHGIPLSYYMEDMLTSKISANASKGRQGLEWVISKINTEVKATTFAICLNENAHFVFFLFFHGNSRSKRLQMQLAKAPTTFSIKHINPSMIWRRRHAKAWTKWAQQQNISGTCSVGRIFFDIFNTTSSTAIQNDTTKTKSNEQSTTNGTGAAASTAKPPSNGSSKWWWAIEPMYHVISGHLLCDSFIVHRFTPRSMFWAFVNRVAHISIIIVHRSSTSSFWIFMGISSTNHTHTLAHFYTHTQQTHSHQH